MERLGDDLAYNQHANTKLSKEQKDYIEASGESTSQWIREAVIARITQERVDNDGDGMVYSPSEGGSIPSPS